MNIQVPEFNNARVLVIGDVMLDRYWHGPTSRISPEAPVPVVKVDQIEDRPGGAGNVALNIATLGAPVTLVGITGNDEAADALERQLVASGVFCQFERLDCCPTITKLRVLSRHQQLIRLDFEEGMEEMNTAGVSKRLNKLLPETKVVVLSDYGKGSLQNVQSIIKEVHKAGKLVLVDPKGTDFEKYKGATLITPNLSEFEAVVGHSKTEKGLVEKAQNLITQLHLDALLITRGEQGMTLVRKGKAELHLPAQAREVYDVTGAGDTVISVLASTLAAGESLESATALANVAAGIVVGKLGTAAVSTPELRRALHDNSESGFGIVNEEQLMLALHDAHAHGEKIIMTNGCFDILHAGHVAYLEQARKLGDRLIVAVNDDASVKRLKGNGRPVNSVERRMAVLAGLKCVDWVVPFIEDTPERLICAVKPSVLAKGGDYKPEQIAGYECVTKNGGEVKVLEYMQGYSTSNIIDSIRATEKS
ncbi:MAG: bifunctional D-glycero-beta-D-manno-heptose-7-phosphate kinase/D-glycero-beta-D-manno-heptose 1-phosphate adenylyltransferase HldE [Gammaproteobacteria bacterium]|nr:bifunctional D-glycero-beta-D-manno-heptose-7-phosphate kinase/D-glycero-beta-D-manno-heptose 1-phosphate adenylyltransferase HldE [Gammaproteobacteria bacterium]